MIMILSLFKMKSIHKSVKHSLVNVVLISFGVLIGFMELVDRGGGVEGSIIINNNYESVKSSNNNNNLTQNIYKEPESESSSTTTRAFEGNNIVKNGTPSFIPKNPAINITSSLLKSSPRGHQPSGGLFSFLRPMFGGGGSTKYFQIGSGHPPPPQNSPHDNHDYLSPGTSVSVTKHRDDIIYDDHPGPPPHHPHDYDDPHPDNPPHNHHHGPPPSGGIIHWPFGIKLKQYHGPGHLASGPYGPPSAPPLAHQGLNPWHNKPEDSGNGLEYEKIKLKYEVYRLKAKNRLARLQLRLERRKILSLILQSIISMLKWWL